MIRTDSGKTAADLACGVQRVFELAAEKVLILDEAWEPAEGTPVFTVEGKYTTRGWTEWTQGFQFGMPILVFDGTSEGKFLELGRSRTVERMAPHLSHTGVHDHGFNNISTYGNLLRLMKEGRIPEDRWEAEFYRLALKVSGAVQASRWTELPGELGYVYTFNGP
ncbi:MAG: glycosyl hydrolase, partial [Spirochaetota bacterium]|nr:glycosyl hydrolase [Spirochaetota bacterium]